LPELFHQRLGVLRHLCASHAAEWEIDVAGRALQEEEGKIVGQGELLAQLAGVIGSNSLGADRAGMRRPVNDTCNPMALFTLRRRSPRVLREIVNLPRSAWRVVELHVPTRKYRFPRVYEQTVSLVGQEFRQLYVQDPGHDEPTVLLTNQKRTSAKQLITRYAQRMLIENALSDAVRFFHMDALSSAVGMKIDFDITLLL
jgi:hypothetical protein